MKLTAWLMDLLYPPRCMICQKIQERAEPVFCGRCADQLPEYDGPMRNVPMYEAAVAPFYYKEPIRSAILRFKFHGLRGYDAQFAAWMAIWVRDKLAGKYDLITWVPCSPIRCFTRGYDQAEVLAKALAEELHCPVVRTLKKVRHNSKQSKTKDAAQRRANVLGVYRAYKPERYAGKRILVVDDVLTTGATLAECGKILRISGAGDLVCAVIAATEKQTN